MTQHYTELKLVAGSKDIEAISEEDDEQVLIPPIYAGYDDGDPNWLPVVEAMVDDSVLYGELVDVTDAGGVEAASLTKQRAIRNVADGLDEIETEAHGGALIDYLAAEKYVTHGEIQAKACGRHRW